MKNKIAVFSAIFMLVLLIVAPVIVVIIAQLVTIRLAGGQVSQYAALIIVANLLGVALDIFTSAVDKLFEMLRKRWAAVTLVMLITDWAVSMLILALANNLWFHLSLDAQMLGMVAGVGSIVSGFMLWLLERFDKDDDKDQTIQAK
ncbi:hypothetical protein [Lacticaseibacillus sharpeae]|uniref:Uncharacterized protein n=1 Tax=Lacticaseibacillus sharpeae JCM 1186 = DSM 20505 TaxID=1291052 RepID=A0A0R1ZMW0_9LACO|nr:hypothetical protein [Lacticaseibacillus sharpeae]KRM56416.1 hypothetical protein FC18_GL000100 [Lacticaseibacillus sharpeae JCM 1186 = DSM 20505]